MSDPMTNLQIEDVLSSIRRLVAEGDKSKSSDKGVSADDAGDTPAPNTQKNTGAADRLVLTPALRVSEIESDSTAEEETSHDSDDTTVSGDATIAAAASSSPDAATAIAASAASVMVLKPAQSVTDFDTAGPARDDTPEDEPADVADITPQEPAFRHFDREALSRDTTPLHAIELPAHDDAPDQSAGTEDAAPEDVTDYGDDLAADTAADPQVDEKLNAFLSDDAMLADAGLDEGVLRDLIVEVIRQELQGVMGERITRNVRKLVRREIHRILAAQDFD